MWDELLKQEATVDNKLEQAEVLDQNEQSLAEIIEEYLAHNTQVWVNVKCAGGSNTSFWHNAELTGMRVNSVEGGYDWQLVLSCLLNRRIEVGYLSFLVRRAGAIPRVVGGCV